MAPLALFRLFLIAFAVVGVLYACVGSGFLSGGTQNWWDELPKPKKMVFVCAVAATLLQGFL